MRLLPLALFAVPVCFLSGCSLSDTGTPAPIQGANIHGTVFGGQRPIVGARVYLLAAGTGGYGGASTSLLTTAIAGTDAIGGYVLTGTGGAYSVTGNYFCTPGTQAYLYVAGGNPGAGDNPAVGLLAALGNCPTAMTYALVDPVVSINEVSTVAAAYAMAGYATDATHVSGSGTTQAQVGLRNAFATAANLAGLRNGNALLATPNANGTAPQAEINTLANLLAACINSTGTQTACTTLFDNSLSGGTTGTRPTETATAILNIAHHPGLNVANLYGIQAGIAVQFLPALNAAPNDFSVGIVWKIPTNQSAFDSSGNLWNTGGSGGLIEYSNAGTLLSPAAGYTGGGLSATGQPSWVAIDPSDNVWATSYSNTTNYSPNNYLSKFSNAGAPISPAGGYPGGGLNAPFSLVIDGAGAVWAGNNAGGSLSKFSNAGVAVAGSPFSTGGQAIANTLAITNTGNVWIESSSPYVQGQNASHSLTELSNAGAFLRAPINGGTNDYGDLSVDAANNVWGTFDPGTFTSRRIFELNATGTPVTGSPFPSNTALTECLTTQVDGDGNVWCASDHDSIAEISPSGVNLSPDAGFVVPNAYGPSYVNIDNAGNVWTTGNYYIDANNNFSSVAIELVGAAAPIITPLSLAIQMGKLGTRP